MSDQQSRPASICISDESHLPLMLEMNPAGAASPVRVYFENWQWRDGIRYFWAFNLTEGGPERTFRYDYRDIRPNVLSALEFVEPASAPRQRDQQALLSILDDDQRAHLQTDVALLVSNIADELISVSGGEILRHSRADVAALFTQVFAGATYQYWADTQPPVIRISDDGTLAWVARRVEVRRSSTMTDGLTQQSAFVSAYTSSYQKENGVWKMDSVASTFLP